MIIIPGKRKDSTVSVHDDFSYNVDKRCNDLYCCSLRRVSGCHGTLIAKKEGESTKYILKANHNHEPNPNTLIMHFLKQEMIEMCHDISPLAPQAIYATVCRRHRNVPPKLTFESIRVQLCREIDRSRPTFPETVDALHEFLEDSESPKAIYKGTAVADNNEKAMLFSNAQLLEVLASASQIFVASQNQVISTIPPMRYIMTVHIQDRNVGIATAIIPCEDMTEAVQRSAWKKLVALAPGMQNRVTSIISDFAKARIAVIHEYFPEAKIYGSWSGYKQAIWNEWSSLGLSTASKDLLSMAMSLPLAPQDFFEESLKVMQNLADHLSRDQTTILQFMTYMRTVWLPITRKLSVYGSPARVSNIVESFQRTTAMKLPSNSDLSKFFGELKKLLAAETKNYGHLQGGTYVNNGRSRINRERTAKILQLQDDLVKKRLPIEGFLKAFNMFYGGYGTNAKPLSTDINGNDITAVAEFLAESSPDNLQEYSNTEDIIQRRAYRRRQIEDAVEAAEQTPADEVLTNSAATGRSNSPRNSREDLSDIADDRSNNNRRRSSSESPTDVINGEPAPDQIEESELSGNNNPNSRSLSASPRTANYVDLNESDEHIYEPPADDYGYWLTAPDELDIIPFHAVSTTDALSESVRKPGICCVCIDVSADQLFRPCNHMCCCKKCASDLVTSHCPLCKQLIFSRITVIST